MGQVLVRNLGDHTINRLKEIAKLHHRSLEGELREILNSVADGHPHRRDLLSKVDAIKQELTGRWEADSTTLIREDRDR